MDPRVWLALSIATPVMGCAATTGVIPVGPGVFAVSAMRAPVRGGGEEARRVVLAEADGFCRAQGGVFVPLELRPDGDPRTPYYPTAFDATFRCGAAGDPAAMPLLEPKQEDKR